MTIIVPTAPGDVTFNDAASASSLVVPKPGDATSGEALLLFAEFRNAGGTITVDDGTRPWTVVGPVSTANQSAQVLVRQLTGADDAVSSYTVRTTGGSGRAVAMICRVLNADLSTPALGALSTPAAESTLTIPGVNTPVANCAVFLCGVAQNASGTGVTFAPPSPYTLLGSRFKSNGAASPSSSALMLAWNLQSVVGASGSVAVPMTSGSTPAASNDQGWAFALRPAPTGPPPPPPGTHSSNIYLRSDGVWRQRTAYVRKAGSWDALV